MDATKELAVMTDGARRMEAFLQERGVVVKHNVMLEALAAGFGSRNWRTMREKLNKPDQFEFASEPAFDPNKRWNVCGWYTDNKQSFDASYPGSCAQEAQVFAQVERMFDEYGSHYTASHVVDLFPDSERNTYDCSNSEFACKSHTDALGNVVRIARNLLGEAPTRGIEECDEWDLKNAVLDLCDDALDSVSFCYELRDLDKHTRDRRGYDADETFVFTDSRGFDFEDFTGQKVLETLCSILTDEAVENECDGDLTDIYHVRALLKYAAAEVGSTFCQHQF